MKILGIKFKNISSLMGEWDIRFDRPPLSDTGLFAIVGPNGSGKSSILDAMTLGLYGETARLRSPESEITSWLADESYSEVTFGVGGNVYRSRWWVRSGPEGLQGPEMSLSEVKGDELLLEDRVIRVRSRVAELSGLDFKRFCRSVLLAQGEFSAFLNALENERMEILEKIIGTEMTRELEQSVRRRVREEEERLQQLRERAASLSPIDQARLDELEMTREQGQEELNEAKRNVTALEESKEWIETVERLAEEQEDADEAVAEAQRRLDASRRAINRLEKALAAAPFADQLNSLGTQSGQTSAAREQLLALQSEIPANEARLREQEERLSSNRLELEQARRSIEERGSELADALSRDREIDAETRRFLEVVARYEEVERTRKVILEEQKELESRIVEDTKRVAWIRGSLDEHAADADLAGVVGKLESRTARLEAIRGQAAQDGLRMTDARKAEGLALKAFERAERAEQRARRKADRSLADKDALERQLTDLLGTDDASSLAAGIQERKKKIAACRELLEISHRFQEEGLNQDIRSELDQVLSIQETLGASLAEEQERLRALETQIVWRDTFRRLSGERSALKSGDPCPLCGAMAHPFLEEGLPDLAELNRTVDELEKHIRSMQEEMDSLSERAVRLGARHKAAEEMQREWAAVCERAGGSWIITDVGLIQDEIRVQEAAIKGSKSLIRSTRWKKWRLSWLGVILGRRLETLSRREKERVRLQTRHESEQRVVMELEEALRGLREEETSVLDDFKAQARAFGEALSQPGEEAALIARLRARSEAYVGWAEEVQDLNLRIQSGEEHLKTLGLSLERHRSEAEALASQTEAIQAGLAPKKAERESLYADLDPSREQQTLEEEVRRLSAEQVELAQEVDVLFQTLESQRRALPQLEKDFEEARSALERGEQELLARIVEAGIQSLDAARKDLKFLEEGELIRQEESAAVRAIEEAESRAAAARESLEAVRSERSMDGTLDEIIRQLDEAAKAAETIEHRVLETARLLEEQRRKEEEYREVLEAVEEQERVYAEVEAEEKLLRAQDGAEIRRRLQRLMLDKLVDQSNGHLELLSGRYLLRTIPDNGLAFQVEDQGLRRSRRSVKTLSGGEAFLVSLSLALALSDMAAAHRKIESLFLDEGFGALDEETLYRVMAALKTLRTNGKMVGVISHVKRLADEIPTQIRVERDPGGRSRLTVVA